MPKSKMKVLSLAILASLISSAGMAKDFTLGDESILTPAEFKERQPDNPQTPGKGPKISTMEYVLNTYKADDALPEVSAYISNWAQYSRGFNVANVQGSYDKVVLSFFGMCGTQIGDPDIVSAVNSLANNVCNNIGRAFEVVTTDPWGDIGSLAGGALTQADQAAAGNPHWEVNSQQVQRWYQGQDRVAGMLGAMKKAKQQNPNLQVAFSIGGWSLSEPFSRMAESSVNRRIFVESIARIFKNYPFFSQVDIDWEYPGGGGADLNSASANDGNNYETLIKELRAELNKNSLNHVKIAIAVAAPKTKLDASNVKALENAGVNIFHLMTYDFFGTPWAEGLAHHTNLQSYPGSEFSTDDSVKYMINTLGINPKKIHIGYAAYSRNARNADVTNISPLQGSYRMPTDGTFVGGSWEKGTTEWEDFEQYFATINASTGLKLDKYPGYKMYTDKEANADYFYNQNKKFFISMDTPRTVYSKAKYAQKMGLGGIFTWMGDYDNGYLLNAAREGLGYELASGGQKVNMEKIIYSCGENITSQSECQALTNLDQIDTGIEWQSSGFVIPSSEALAPGDRAVFKVFNNQGGEVPELRKSYYHNPDKYTEELSGSTWAYRLANDHVNKLAEVKAGQLQPDGTFKAIRGDNPIYFAEGHGLARAEVTIVKADVEPDMVEWEHSHYLIPSQEALSPGDRAVFKVFDAQGKEIPALRKSYYHNPETFSDDLPGTVWSYRLAKDHVNKLEYIQAGELQEDGTFKPIRGNNPIYFAKGHGFSRAEVTIVKAEGQLAYEFIYPQYTGYYKSGTLVLQPKDGKVYECKPWPADGYCSQYSPSANHFEPGVGSFWQEAWIEKN